MDKVIIWGIGEVYNKYKNNIDFEVMKNNIDIIAMVSKDKFADILDGKNIISKNDISKYDYDYIIVFSDNFDLIKEEAVMLGITREDIIDGRVFRIPCFDFSRYSQLIRKPVTIISDDCWGGFVYNYLGLKTTSPFKNFYILNNDYIKLCDNLKYYISQPLKMEVEGDIYEEIDPVGSLGEGDMKIYLYFNHYISFKDAYEAWEKRRNRVNFDNIIIKMIVPLAQDRYTITDRNSVIEAFSKLPFDNKICFCNKKIEINDICSFSRLFYNMKKSEMISTKILANYVNDMDFLTKSIDIFKLLCGEKDYIRESIN